MAYNVPNCVASLLNTGLSNCLDNLGYDAMLIWTPESFEHATESDAETEADWLTAINANNAYPFPIFEEVEPALEDDVVQETNTGSRIFVREGKYGGAGMARVALCDLPKLRTFNNVTGRVFIVTGNDKIWGTSPDGAKFKGFLLSYFRVSKLGANDGSTARMVRIEYQLKTPSEMGDYPAVPQLTWSPLTLTGLVDTTLTVDASAATEVTVTVTRNCDGEGVEGLVAGDFTILDSSSGAEVISELSDDGDGVYTLTVSTMSADDYTINLKAASAQTTGGYAPGAADTFTIS